MMMALGDYAIPVVIFLIVLMGILKKTDVFSCFIDGAKEGLQVSFNILPSLVGLMTAVAMFKASGALDLITYGLRPLADFLHIPKEVIPLTLLRPISGSGSLAILENILSTHGADTYPGMVASVIQGSTETTFYTIAIYYGSIGIKNTRHTVPSALAADITGFVASAFFVRLLLM